MLTQDKLKEYLDYNPDTGEFFWLRGRGRAAEGSLAGSLLTDATKKEYWRIRLFGKPYQAHRLAFLFMNGEFPELEVDHIDGNSLNNRWENLREVTRYENSQNLQKSKRNTSGVLGVYWCKRSDRWHARIRVEGKTVHLGYFENIEDAAKARKKAVKEFGFHKNHGIKAGEDSE